MYIKKFQSSPLTMTISYYQTLANDEKEQDDEESMKVLSIIKRFGLSLSTIENAPIKLNALELDNVFGTTDEINFILKEQYIERLKSNFFRLIGASSLLGNPIQLSNSIGTGVKDFFFKPIEGIVDGPLEAGKGLVTGTQSLVKHTTEGVFGSVASIVGSASKGILVLSDDQEFIKNRESNNISERPQHVVDGIGYGLKGFGKSLLSGVTGVVEKPLEGAKKKGIGGFFSGTLKGAAGLITKPVSGTFDFIAKTADGIKNTP